MSFCSNCGDAFQEGMKFCPNCGAERVQSVRGGMPALDRAGMKLSMKAVKSPHSWIFILTSAFALFLGVIAVGGSTYWFGLVMIAMVLVASAAELGIPRKKPWARPAGYVGGSLFVILGALLTFSGGQFVLGLLAGVLFLIFGAYLIYRLRYPPRTVA